jgi:hypothetical protein
MSTGAGAQAPSRRFVAYLHPTGHYSKNPYIVSHSELQQNRGSNILEMDKTVIE